MTNVRFAYAYRYSYYFYGKSNSGLCCKDC